MAREQQPQQQAANPIIQICETAKEVEAHAFVPGFGSCEICGRAKNHQVHTLPEKP